MNLKKKQEEIDRLLEEFLFLSRGVRPSIETQFDWKFNLIRSKTSSISLGHMSNASSYFEW